MKTKIYFVSGAKGFVGSRFIIDSLKKGLKIKALVSSMDNIGQIFEGFDKNIEFIRGDLHIPASYMSSLENCDAVVHTGEKAGYWGRREEFITTNVISTMRLAQISKNIGIKRFIYLSSEAAVRPIKFKIVNDIKTLSPGTPYPDKKNFGRFYYGLSKMLAENSLLALNDHNFGVTILRPHMIWGKGNTDLNIILTGLTRKMPFMLINGKNMIYPSSHIDTVVHYIHQALMADASIGKVFHILDEDNMTMQDYIEKMIRALNFGRPHLLIPYHLGYFAAVILESAARIVRLFDPDFIPAFDRFIIDGLGRNMLGDIKQTVDILGIPPKLEFDKAIEESAAWYWENL